MTLEIPSMRKRDPASPPDDPAGPVPWDRFIAGTKAMVKTTPLMATRGRRRAR